MNAMLNFRDYFLLSEANLFNPDKLLDDIDTILKAKQANNPEIQNWFQKQYLKWYLAPGDDNHKNIARHKFQEGDPEWAKKSDIVDFTQFDNENMESLNHMIDYFLSLQPLDLKKIFKEPYEVIVAKIQQWDEQLKKHMAEGTLNNTEGVDVKTLMTFHDGFKVIQLLSKEAFADEGRAMGHCLGANYHSSSAVIYSLRDTTNEPHATIQCGKSFNAEAQGIVQAKGKGNTTVIEKYRPYLHTEMVEILEC